MDSTSGAASRRFICTKHGWDSPYSSCPKCDLIEFAIAGRSLPQLPAAETDPKILRLLTRIAELLEQMVNSRPQI